jgi:N utilization substance protein B
MIQRIDVPYKVVIDEYVELTKLFGSQDAHKYVNGVLDQLARTARSIEVNAAKGSGRG